MKRAGLWTAVVALVLLGSVMFISALVMHQSYGPAVDPSIGSSDPKLRQMVEAQRQQREREEYKIEFQYLTMAAIEFTVAAFLAGMARRTD